jgi:hypothetical protein
MIGKNAIMLKTNFEIVKRFFDDVEEIKILQVSEGAKPQENIPEEKITDISESRSADELFGSKKSFSDDGDSNSLDSSDLEDEDKKEDEFSF